MVNQGKKGRKLFSSMNMFHNNSDGREQLIDPSSRPFTSDGGHAHEQHRNLPEPRLMPKAVSLESPRSQSDPRFASSSTHKPLPAKPAESQAGRSLNPKTSFINFKNSGRHEKSKSKSPGKSGIKGQISAPYDVRKPVYPLMDQFEDAYEHPAPQLSTSQQAVYLQATHQQSTHQQVTHQQATNQRVTYQQTTNQQPTYQQVTHQQTTYQRSTHQQATHQHPTYQSVQESAPLGPSRPQPKLKQSVPRSASAFSFTSMFKFGGGKNKFAGDRVKSGWFTTRRSEADDDGEQDELPPSISGSPVAAHDMVLDNLEDNIRAHKTIGESPKLRRFFYGGPPCDEAGSSKRPNQNSTGSPTLKTRKSMGVIKHDDDDSLLSPDNDDTMKDRSGQSGSPQQKRKTIYGRPHDSFQSTSALVEPTFQFGECIPGKSDGHDQIRGPGQTVRKPRPAPLQLNESTGNRFGITVVRAEEYHPNGRYNEDVSGLHQHSNVMECVEPPAWYSEAVNRGLGVSIPTTQEPESRESHARHPTRRDSPYIGSSFSFNKETALRQQPPIPPPIPPPVPRLEVKRASDTSKRNSMEAGLGYESPTQPKRNRTSSISESLVAEYREMCARDQYYAFRDDYPLEDVDNDNDAYMENVGLLSDFDNGASEEAEGSRDAWEPEEFEMDTEKQPTASAIEAEDEIMSLKPQEPRFPHHGEAFDTMAPRRRSMPPPRKHLMTPECNFNAQWPYKTQNEGFTQPIAPPIPSCPPPSPPRNDPATAWSGGLASTNRKKTSGNIYGGRVWFEEDYADADDGDADDDEDYVGMAF